MSVTHVYDLMQVVHVTTDAGVAPNMNYPVNTSDIKLFRDVRTTLTFYVKDIDRKPVVFPAGENVVFTMSDRKRGGVLLSRVASLVIPAKAMYQVAIDGADIEGFDLGDYYYSVVKQDAQGILTPLFNDRNHTITGVVEIVIGPYITPAASTEIGVDAFLMEAIGNPTSFQGVSGAYAGAASVGDVTGQHQIAIYSNGFDGDFVVQANLDLAPVSDTTQWFEVTRLDLATVTTVTPLSFEGNFMWVRFVLVPHPGQMDLSGFEKVLYRN